MIPRERILHKLDSLLAGNDYDGAKRLLQYWLSEATATRDDHGALLMENELMGLCRKLGEKEQALAFAHSALDRITRMNIGDNVGAATTCLNCATVYKAFGLSEKAIPLFETAQKVYEKELEPHDDRLAGLYNNMALALVDLKRFEEARALYKKAISILQERKDGELEIAITYLNLASAAESELGLEDAAETIDAFAKKAEAILEAHTPRDGYYAFVCEKCATVFDYYGYFYYAKELADRARRIYEA